MSQYDDLKKLLAVQCKYPMFSVDKAADELTYKMTDCTVGEILGIAPDGAPAMPKLVDMLRHQLVISQLRAKGAFDVLESDYPHVDVSEIKPFVGGKYPARDKLEKEIESFAIDDDKAELGESEMGKIDRLVDQINKLPPRIKTLTQAMRKILAEQGDDSGIQIPLVELLAAEMRLDQSKGELELTGEIGRQLPRMHTLNRMGLTTDIQKEMPLLKKRVAALGNIVNDIDKIAFRELTAEEAPSEWAGPDEVDKVIRTTKNAMQEFVGVLAPILDRLNQILDTAPPEKQAGL